MPVYMFISCTVLVVSALLYDIARRYIQVLHERTSRDASHIRELHVVKAAVVALQQRDDRRAEALTTHERGIRDLRDQLSATGDSFHKRLMELEQQPDTRNSVDSVATVEFIAKQQVWNDQQDAILKLLHKELPEKFGKVDEKIQDLDRRLMDKVIGPKQVGVYGR
jgi:hypothetical protein